MVDHVPSNTPYLVMASRRCAVTCFYGIFTHPYPARRYFMFLPHVRMGAVDALVQRKGEKPSSSLGC